MTVLELGEKLPELLINARQNSAQTWVLTLTDKTSSTPVVIEGAVTIEVEGRPLWVGSITGPTITWALQAADVQLRTGRHPAVLVRTYGDDGRDVWARGAVDVR